jgi:hypothetical protein
MNFLAPSSKSSVLQKNEDINKNSTSRAGSAGKIYLVIGDVWRYVVFHAVAVPENWWRHALNFKNSCKHFERSSKVFTSITSNLFRDFIS